MRKLIVLLVVVVLGVAGAYLAAGVMPAPAVVIESRTIRSPPAALEAGLQTSELRCTASGLGLRT